MFSTLLLGDGSPPATPNLPAAGPLLCTNNTAGFGSAGFQFNVTAKTGTFTSSSSLGSPQTIPVTYFAAGDSVNPADYEIRATVVSGPTTGANIALTGTSASLNTWYTLSAIPFSGQFNFQCSGRRSGYLDVSFTIRHRTQTAISSTRTYRISQQSDAVIPSFGGGFGNTISLSVFSAESFVMGFYIDNASAANEWMLRSYRNGTFIQGLTGSVSFGGIPESEYTIGIHSATNTGAMPFNSGTGGGLISDKRSMGASSTSGMYYAGTGATGAGSALLVVRFQHATDQNVFSDLSLTFNKTT